MADILIKNASIITMDKNQRIFKDGAVKIEGNKIADIGPTKDIEKKYTAKQTIDASGKAVMPGLVNAHTHLNMIFGRSLAYDNNLLDWLAKVQTPLLSSFTPEDWEVAEMLGCIENIKNGCTCVNEVNFATHDAYKESVDERCMKAFEKTGVRGILSRGYVDGMFFPGYTETIENIVTRMENLIKDWNGGANDRIRVQLAPLVPWACSPDLLKETRKLADKYGVGIHLHTAETPDYNNLVKENFGYASNIEYLADVGNLGADVQLNHAIWLSDSDMNKIAESNTNVVHDPTSNMLLASGIAKIPKMFELGINVGLACDGPACNNNQDMISSMKFGSLLHKVESLNPVAITAPQVMEMATFKGAKALGLVDDVGSLEAGKKADLIIIDLKKAHLVPVLDVIGVIVYSANGSDVNDVIVDGELIMQDRTIRTVDENEILETAQKAAQDCLERAGLSDLMVPS